MAKKKPYKEILEHWENVASIGCLVSSSDDAEIHHCKSGSLSKLGIHTSLSKKNSDWLVIPLSVEWHRGKHGIHTIGVETWELKFDPQIKLLQVICIMLDVNVFEKAGYELIGGRYEKL